MTKDDTLYARWLNNELTPQEVLQLKESGEWDELQRIVDASEKLTLPKYDVESGLRVAKQRRSPKAKVRSVGSWPWLQMAAGLAIVLGAIYWVLNRPTLVNVDLAAQAQHVLPDNSLCRLNADSKIRFVKRRWKSERTLKLEGEGYFEVESGVPFTVQTRLGDVKVLGTSFNVRMRDERLYVTCYEGSVDVIAGQRSMKIGASEEVRFINGEGSIAKVDVKAGPSWIGGTSSFVDEPVQHVFREIERQFGLRIESSVDRLFDGSFDHVNLEEAVRDVCIPLDLQFDIDLTKGVVSITQ